MFLPPSSLDYRTEPPVPAELVILPYLKIYHEKKDIFGKFTK
jgi:hypothetical protein